MEICEWTGTACASPLVAEFTMTTGPGSETVRVVPEDEHYIVNWHTDEFDLDAAKPYRIRVLVAGTELGHADIDVVSSGKDVRNVDTDEYIPLVDGQTLPIKFRIEEGAVFVLDASGGTIAAINGAVNLSVPDGALSEEVGITIQPAETFPSDPGLLPGTVFDFGPNGLEFAEPVEVRIRYDVTALPTGTLEAELRLHKLIAGTWQQLPGSNVDVMAHEVVGVVHDFSRHGVVRATCPNPGRAPHWPVCPDDRMTLGQDYGQFTPQPRRQEIPHHHTGLDIVAGAGSFVYAVAPGTVADVCLDDLANGCHGMDGVVIVRHSVELLPGMSYTLYAHLTRRSIQLLGLQQGSRLDAGQALGQTRDLRASDGNDLTDHVHFEVKSEAILDNPVKAPSSCVNPGDGASVDTCYGYLLRHPDEHGFADPVLLFHSTSAISQVLVRVTDVGATAPGVALRVGPSAYREIGRITSTGRQFVAQRRAEATGNGEPSCDEGWYEVADPDGQYLNDPVFATESLRDAWICSGDAGERWVEAVSFSFTGRSLLGIAYGAGVLWATEEVARDVVRILKIDAQTGQLLSESGTMGWNGRGITVGQGSLWVTDALADVIHEVNLDDFTEMRPPFRTPGTEPTGIAFDGTDLWLIDPFFERIYQLSTTGDVISSLAVPNAFRTGLEWETDGVWTTTAETEVSHYPTDTDGTISATKTLESLPSGTFVYDIAIGDGKVYISAGDTIYARDWVARAAVAGGVMPLAQTQQ